MTHLIPPSLRPFLPAMFRQLPALLLFLAAGLFTPTFARAQALPPILAPVSYATSVDLAAGLAPFSIEFDRAPDLLTVDAFLRQADGFQFWTDTVSADPLTSTYDGLFGLGPLGTQAVLTAVSIPATGLLNYIWPRDATYTGPRDSGGWGEVQAQGAYALDGATVSFDVPLSVLNATADGNFYYVFETFQYSEGGSINYFGTSGQDYCVSCVPEPAPLLLLGIGICVLAALARRARPHPNRFAAR